VLSCSAVQTNTPPATLHPPPPETPSYEIDSFEDLRGADARRAILFLAVMAAHAVGEGSGVGVSFSGDRGWAAGTTVALAIGLHNIPEGLAVATVLAARGTPPARLLLWTTVTALPQAVVAVPSFLFVEAFAALLPLAMGFAAGCMVWIVVAELLPDAVENLDSATVATAATASAAWWVFPSSVGCLGWELGWVGGGPGICAGGAQAHSLTYSTTTINHTLIRFHRLQGLAVYVDYLERGTGGTDGGGPAAAGPPLAPLCIGLLLPCLAPGVAAGIATNLLPSRPAALGLSGGALAAGGALSALWLLVRGQQGLGWTLLLVPLGAAAAAALWHELAPGGGGGSSSGGGGGFALISAGSGGLWESSKKDDDKNLAAAADGCFRNGSGGLLPVHATAASHYQQYDRYGQQQPPSSPRQRHPFSAANGGGGGGGFPPQQQQQQQQQYSGHPSPLNHNYQQQQQYHAAPSPPQYAPAGPAAATTAADPAAAYSPAGAEDVNGASAGAHHGRSWAIAAMATPSRQASTELHNGSPLPRAPSHRLNRQSSCGPRSTTGGGGPAPLLVWGLAGRLSFAGAAAVLLSCVAQGAALGGALLAKGGDEGSLMVPMALHGGLACGVWGWG
jgi:hypothetical protein